MEFGGFDDKDFAVFSLPTFEARMPALKQRITPKLRALGQDLAAVLSRAAREPLHPHPAQHLRRRTNPPEATWVAFSSLPRAYKPVTHYRVAIGAFGLRCLVFEEDYADDKPVLAAGLRANAEKLAELFARWPGLIAFDLGRGRRARGAEVTADCLRDLADRLDRVVGQHAAFGFEYTPARVADKEPDMIARRIVNDARKLAPIYRVGRVPGLAL